MKKISKPTASDRTVDMFTGTTAVDKAAAAIEEVENDKRAAFEPIEKSVDRYRAGAFQGQEWTSRWFPVDGTGVVAPDRTSFRWTQSGGFMYLEQVRNGKNGVAFHYAGVMFPCNDWNELVDATSKAHKAIKGGK